MSGDPRPQPPERTPNPTAQAPPETLLPLATPAPTGNPETPLAFTPGSRPLPEYELIALLGRGGFGEVWKAVGPGGFEVALKFIRLGAQAGSIELRSLELMKGIRHAHLLPMFGAWQRDDLLIIAMELADRTLWHRWREAADQGLPGIPPVELLGYLHEAAKGLDFLNERQHPSGTDKVVGIQHKDIKPENLMLVGGTVKVADFGLAKLLEHTSTQISGGLTPAYAAPEFFRGQATRWSDQYCLAITYCKLRGGKLPFEGGAMQVMAGHLMQEPDLGMLPAEERPAVARALAKEPEQRWPTCREFAEAVTQCSGAVGVFQGVTSRSAPVAPESATVVSTDPKRRSRKVGLAAAIIVPALAALGVAYWENRGRLDPDASQAAAVASTAADGSKPALKPPVPLAVLRLLPVTELAVDTGKSGFLEVRVERQDCTGPVRLQVDDLPAGVTAVTPVTVDTDRDAGRIELRAADDSQGEAKTVRVRAELGELRAEQPALIRVRVAPSLRLLAIDDVALQARHLRSLDVHLHRRNYTGPVELRLEGLPDGVKAPSTTVPAGADTGRLEVSASVRPGLHTRDVRVVAVASGLRSETTFRLTVCAPRTPAQWLAEYSEAIRRHSDDAGNYNDRGRVYAEQKDYDKALADFTAAIRLDPGYAAAYWNRGASYVNIKKYDKALADCDRAIELEPHLAGAFNSRGVARAERREYDKALADYNEAIRLDPRYTSAYSNRGNIYVRNKEYDKARADYEAALKLNPRYALAFIGRANLYRALKDLDKALTDYDEAIRLDPRAPIGFNNRGNVFLDREQYDKALADYNEAIRLDPHYALAYTNRARVYEKKGEPARAKADRQKAASLDATSGE
jgi:tetratricopeptide (TPR) repeat protein